jgi:hypothetical protein
MVSDFSLDLNCFDLDSNPEPLFTRSSTFTWRLIEHLTHLCFHIIHIQLWPISLVKTFDYGKLQLPRRGT